MSSLIQRNKQFASHIFEGKTSRPDFHYKPPLVPLKELGDFTLSPEPYTNPYSPLPGRPAQHRAWNVPAARCQDGINTIAITLPDMLAVGVNSTVPCEVAAGMDPVALRAQFGRELRIGGGFDKRIVTKGPEAVKAELDRLAPVIREGGFVPGVDHSVPADVSWDHYRRYLDLLTKVTA